MSEDGDATKTGRKRLTIPISTEVVGFAPPKEPLICQSRSGRWRIAHVYDRDGVCIFCNEIACE